MDRIRRLTVEAHRRVLRQLPAVWIEWGRDDPEVVLEAPARRSEEPGDPEGAAGNCQPIVDLWSDADPELRPRAHGVKERLEALEAPG